MSTQALKPQAGNHHRRESTVSVSPSRASVTARLATPVYGSPGLETKSTLSRMNKARRHLWLERQAPLRRGPELPRSPKHYVARWDSHRRGSVRRQTRARRLVQVDCPVPTGVLKRQTTAPSRPIRKPDS